MSCHHPIQVQALFRSITSRVRPKTPALRLALAAGVHALAACAPLPEVSLTIDGEPITSESGASVSVSIALAGPPAQPVTIRASSTTPAEGRVSAPVTFDVDNWQAPQVIVVSGVDDSERDGAIAYDVVFAAAGSYSGTRIVGVLHFVNRDDDGTTFVGLGALPGTDASYARAISDAADVVVGWSHGPDGNVAVRWRSDTGLASLGGPLSQAHSVSPNGTLIAGTIADASYEQGRAAVIWHDDGSYDQLPGPSTTDGSVLFWIIDTGAVRDDGHMFGTCLQYNAYGTPLKCVYDPTDRDLLQVDGGGEIFAADAQGNYAGTNYPDPHAAGVWGSVAVFNDVQLGYPADASCIRPHACRSEARAFSEAGAVIVGTSQVPAPSSSAATPPEFEAPLYDTAFVFTQAEGMTRLSDPGADAHIASAAYAIDASGRLIGGYATTAKGQTAVLWIDREPHVLSELLQDYECTLADDWSLQDVRAITPDGLTLVGHGIDPSGHAQAFRVTLPEDL